VDKAAKEIDAVNCIKIIKHRPAEDFFSGELSSTKVNLIGYNTDAFAFEKSLQPLLKKNHNKALVLGTGGASRAVTYVLGQLGIDYLLVSRKAARRQIRYEDITREMMQERQLIINTTPLGMSPDIDSSPEIPYEFITGQHLLYDLVYNPAETEFLKRGREKGAGTKNGLEMLELQAEKSWEIWNKEE